MVTRVLLLTQWFDPEPTFKGMAFARELVRQGFEVEVVTGFPNYPGGRVYPGYRVRVLQRENADGVQITRVPLYASHDSSALKRILNYVSFSTSALIYCLFFARRADVLYAYQPPLTVGLTASIIRVLRRIPVVYDVQDMWPDTLRASGMVNSERALEMVGRLCRWVYGRVDHVVAQSPGFKSLLLQRGVPDNKVTVIPNWADESALALAPDSIPDVFPGPERFRIVFAGNMGKAQALDKVLDAASILRQRGSRVSFVLIGSGVELERLRAKADECTLDNVVFLPRVPMAAVGAVLNAADALLVHLRDDPLFRITVPSKTQAYMAVGKPLLMAVGGDAADLVFKSGAGVLAEPENPMSLADAAQTLASLPRHVLAAYGHSAGMYYRECLSLRVGVAKFGSIFSKLARSA